MENAASLPGAVAALAARSGAGSAVAARRVRFTQAGRMRSGPGGRWMDFRARQTVVLGENSFSWKARSGPFGVLEIEDSLDGGRGRLVVRAFGLVPLLRAPAGRDLDRGELMRYVAELAWAPDAMLLNRALRWNALSERVFAVSAGPAENAATVMLECDDAGRIVTVTAPDRPMFANGKYCATPWFGRFCEYRRHAGYCLPFRAEVGWDIGGVRVVCWEGRLLDWIAEP